MIRGKVSKEEHEIIKEMRKNGKGYNEIAKVLNCKKERVKNYCANNGMGGFAKKTWTNPKMRLEVFINNIKENHPTFQYISGYTNCDSIVIVKCKVCNTTMKKNAQFARKNKQSVCINCEAIQKVTKERDDNVRSLRLKIMRESVKPERAIREITIIRCAECGRVFEGKRKYCSLSCANRINNQRKELKRRNILSDGDKTITLPKVIRAENNICYLCNKECDSDDYVISKEGYFIVGKNYPSIEHVIPISKGGTHTWDNVKLAHHQCNSIKSNKDIEENVGQLSLMI